MRILLRPHAFRDACVRIPAARLLHDLPAFFKRADLAPDFILKRRAHSLEGVHVLDLGLRAELVGPFRAHAHVDVAPHIPLLEIALAHAAVNENLLQRKEVFECLFGRGEIRLRNNFHQRRARAVEIHSARSLEMHVLADILFEMNARHADRLLNPADRDVHRAANAQRLVVLRNLVVFRHIRIEVVLPVELAVLADA